MKMKMGKSLEIIAIAFYMIFMSMNIVGYTYNAFELGSISELAFLDPDIPIMIALLVANVAFVAFTIVIGLNIRSRNLDHKRTVGGYSLQITRLEAKAFTYLQTAANYKTILDIEFGVDNRPIDKAVSREIVDYQLKLMSNVGHDKMLEMANAMLMSDYGAKHRSKPTFLELPETKPEDLATINTHVAKLNGSDVVEAFANSLPKIKRNESGFYDHHEFIGRRHMFYEGGQQFVCAITSVLTKEMCGKVVKADRENYRRVTGKDRDTVYFTREQMEALYVEA